MEKYEGHSVSKIGSSHIKNNTICQDNSANYYCEDYAIAIVCDGHGSNKHFRSDKGSLLATRVGIRAIKEFLSYEKSFLKEKDKLLSQLEKNIILNWNEAIRSHLSDVPFETSELINFNDNEKLSVNSNIESAYGTTFIAIVITDKYCFGMQIGDGDCIVLKNNGEIEFPIPEDDRLQFNVTTSLCDRKAITNFRHFWIDEPIAAAIITTDGVRNSFSSKEYYIKFCKTILETYNEMEISQANSEIESFLPQLSEKGSGDDVSISIIYSKDRLQTALNDIDSGVSINDSNIVYENADEKVDQSCETEADILKDSNTETSLMLEE